MVKLYHIMAKLDHIMIKPNNVMIKLKYIIIKSKHKTMTANNIIFQCTLRFIKTMERHSCLAVLYGTKLNYEFIVILFLVLVY